MTRLRAAAALTNERDFVVMGGQAVLGRFPSAPDALLASVEPDLYPRDAIEKSDVIDGAIGELSQFHVTFGYYAHGVDDTTAVLPAGWQDSPRAIAQRAHRRSDRLVPRGPRFRERSWWPIATVTERSSACCYRSIWLTPPSSKDDCVTFRFLPTHRRPAGLAPTAAERVTANVARCPSTERQRPCVQVEDVEEVARLVASGQCQELVDGEIDGVQYVARNVVGHRRQEPPGGVVRPLDLPTGATLRHHRADVAGQPYVDGDIVAGTGEPLCIPGERI